MQHRGAIHDLGAKRMALFAGVCLIASAAFGVLSVVSALQNWNASYSRPVGAAWFFGTGCSLFTLLSAWLLAESLTARFRFDGRTLLARRLGKQIRCDVRSIERLTWHRNGRVSITAARRSLTLQADLMSGRAWQQAARSLRAAVPVAAQRGWSDRRRGEARRRLSRRLTRRRAEQRRAAQRVPCPILPLSLGLGAVAGSFLVPTLFPNLTDVSDDRSLQPLAWSFGYAAAGLASVLFALSDWPKRGASLGTTLLSCAGAFLGIVAAVRFAIYFQQLLNSVDSTS